MKRMDKSYTAAWVLLSVFIPMVLLSSLHVHPERLSDIECIECIEHMMHNGHIVTDQASVDCPLCAFQSCAYQGEATVEVACHLHATRVEMPHGTPAIVAGATGLKTTRAPPATFCA